MTHQDLSDHVRDRFGITISKHQYEGFRTYVGLLHTWSDRVRLISRQDRDHIWARHIIDCMSLVPLLPTAGAILDLGSGAGLPGVPIKIMRSDLQIVLLEPQRMKSLFLNQVVEILGIPGLQVVRERAEHIATDKAHVARYAVVTARAVGPLLNLWHLAKPLLMQKGRLIAMKGPGETGALTREMHSDLTIKETRIWLPMNQRERVLIEITGRDVSRETP